jgi:hypothetical protein
LASFMTFNIFRLVQDCKRSVFFFLAGFMGNVAVEGAWTKAVEDGGEIKRIRQIDKIANPPPH